MKKITTGILATLACLACLSGCSGKGNEKDPTGIEASVALEGAKAFLEAKYKKQVSEVSANYEMPNTVSYDGVTYEITWSVHTVPLPNAHNRAAGPPRSEYEKTGPRSPPPPLRSGSSA